MLCEQLFERLRRRYVGQQHGLHLHLPLQPERDGCRDVHGQQQQQRYFHHLRVQSLQFLRLQSLQFVRLQSLQFVRLQSLQFVRLQSLQFVRLVLERLKISKDARPRRAAHFCRVRHTMEGRREPI